MTKTFAGKTKQEWLEVAKEYAERRQEGLNQEASENFRSMAVWQELHDLYRSFANYADTGEIYACVLFDLEGELIPGKWITSNYGTSYLTAQGEWLNPSKAMKEETRVKNNAKKGFYDGRATFKVYYNSYENKAYAKTTLEGEMIRIIDNGKTL